MSDTTKILLLTTLLLTSPGSALAQSKSGPTVIVTCGASAGHAYFHESGLIQSNEKGWTEDAVGEGSFIVQNDGENFDLIYRDQLGLNSATDNGAVILPAHVDDSSIVLVVIYPSNGNTEVYNFQGLDTSESEVSWTSTKVGSLINKSSVFYAQCQH